MLGLNCPGAGAGFSCHNHSNWSDGANSLEEMCRRGKADGIRVLGISDHWVEPPYDGFDSDTWAMKLDRLDEYMETLLRLRKELEDDDFSLKIGLEVDFFFENISSVLARLKNYPLDYLIGSVHYSGTFPIDHIIDEWLPLTPEEKEQICETYWEKVAGAAAVREFDFIGHLDLPKKFGMIDNNKYLPHALRVLDIIKENGGAIELNTAGFFKECGEPYPSPEILKAAADRKIPVIINADAHHESHLTRHFEAARELLRQAGFPEF